MIILGSDSTDSLAPLIVGLLGVALACAIAYYHGAWQ